MTTATAPEPQKVWTEADLLAMPDDGVRRWIINGQLREQPSEFPEAGCFVRSRAASSLLSHMGTEFGEWIRTHLQPRGAVYLSRVGLRLRCDPDTILDPDVVYAQPELVAAQDDDTTTMIDGVPTLAVEILSPNVTQEQLKEKLAIYRKSGVPVVWVIDPDDRTVTVYRPGKEPELFNVTHRLPVESALPGFTPAVLELFE